MLGCDKTAAIAVLNRLALALLQTLGGLPFPLRRFVGGQLGNAMRLVMRQRARIVVRNLEAAFPELPPPEHQRLMRRHFRCLGQMVLDDIWSMRASTDQLRALIKIEGVQHFPTNSAVIVLVPHFLGFNVGGLLVTWLHKNSAFLYKPLHDPFWGRVVSRMRERFGAIGISAKQPLLLRHCVQHLKAGGLLYYLPDINLVRNKHTVFARFLGVKNTATSVSVKSLAKLSGAPVAPCLFSITSEGYKATILPPLENLKDYSDHAVAEWINQIIANHVKKAPESYYWIHRRFKTRPTNEEADFYN